MKTIIFALFVLVAAADIASGQEASAPENIPVFLLNRRIPLVVTQQDAESSMSVAAAMTTLQTISQLPETEPSGPFCQGDCVEFKTVATFEPKIFGTELPACEAVRAGLAIATSAWTELQTSTSNLRDLTDELAAATSPEQFSAVVVRINALIARMNDLTSRIRTSYPLSFNTVDRKVVFHWTVTPGHVLTGWPRSWVPQTLALSLEEALIRGFTWKKGQGQITALGGIDGLPTGSGRTLRFTMDATPVQICSEGRDVALAGQLSFSFGLYDRALTAWRSNAHTTIRAIFKGTPP